MTRENGIGVGESEEDQWKKKHGEKFKRAAKGTTVIWKLSCKLVFLAFSDLDTEVHLKYQPELRFIKLPLPCM